MPPEIIEGAAPAAPVVPPVVTAVPPAVPAVTDEPVAPAVPAVPPAEPAAEVWAASGDAFVDTLANGYLAKGGNVAAFEAILEDVGNSGTLTESARVELRKTFGDLADAFIPTIEEKAKAHLTWVTAERKAVFDAAGGEASFKTMQAWSTANLDEATRNFLTSSLQQGGASAQLAIGQLRNLMIQKGATVTDAVHKVEGAPADTGGAIGLADFIAQKAVLTRKGDTAGVAALEAKARSSMAAAKAKGQRWR